MRSRIHRGRVLLREALAHRAPGTRPAEPGTRYAQAGLGAGQFEAGSAELAGGGV